MRRQHHTSSNTADDPSCPTEVAELATNDLEGRGGPSASCCRLRWGLVKTLDPKAEGVG